MRYVCRKNKYGKQLRRSDTSNEQDETIMVDFKIHNNKITNYQLRMENEIQITNYALQTIKLKMNF